MKANYFLLFLICVVGNTLKAQTYEMDDVNGQTINTCSGTFFDSQDVLIGGQSYYNSGENYTTTFCSGTTDGIKFNFSMIQTVTAEDTLWVYDGTSAASPLVSVFAGGYTGVSVLGYSGCLTFVFKSSTNLTVSLGWEATIECINIPLISLQPGCTNMGFEDGNFNGWYGTYGIAGNVNRAIATGPPGAQNPTYTPHVFGSTASTQMAITAGAGVDPFGLFPVVYPNGGNNSMMLGDADNGGYGGASVEQKFTVTAANAMMIYSYALVIQDASGGGSPPHNATEQPFFNIDVFDCNGDSVFCGAYHVVGGPGIPGFTASLADPNVYYKPWTDIFLDLTPFVGTCVTVRFTTGDCSLGAHYGYAYLDVFCGPMAIVGDQLICPEDSTTLFAPKGAAAYAWTPGGETTDSIRVSPAVLTAYSCTVTAIPGLTCTTLLEYNVDVYPPALVTVDSATICLGEEATLTATPNSAGGTFLWTPGGQTTSTIKVSPTTTTEYTCTFTDANGCDHDSIGLVTVKTLSLAGIPINPTCSGASNGSISIQPNGTAPYSYVWSSSVGTAALETNLGAGNVTVTVTDGFGCVQDSTFILTQPKLVISSITGSTPALCKDSLNGTATVAGLDPLTAYSYDWYSASNQTTATVTNLGAGTHNVQVVDPNSGCTDTATVIITEPSQVTVTAASPAICLGENVDLTAIGTNGNGPAYTYNWDGGTFIGNPYNVSPTSTAVYTVFAMDANACPSLPINVTVTVDPPLALVINPFDSVICIGESVTMAAVVSAGNGGPYTYAWDNGFNGLSQTIAPTTTTTYTVTVNDGCSPPVSKSVTVLVNPLPVVDFIVDNQDGCEAENQVFTFINIPGASDRILTWSFGDGVVISGLGANYSPNVDSVTHIYNNAGQYDVQLTVTTTAATGSCTNSLIKQGYITIFKSPRADFAIEPNPATTLDPSFYFQNQSSSFAIPSSLDYQWNIAGLDTSTLQNPSYTFEEEIGRYLISLTVTDVNGCIDSTAKNAIVIGDYALYVPNAFTPDEDGVNEGFFPKGFGILETDYTFFIFDRWGELIYESNKKFGAWDGTYKGGLVKNDVYIWKITFKDINGEKHNRMGRVSVVR